MKRVLLKIAYDGTNYCGWQMQINGITVEEIINKTLSELLGEEILVIGASRTDSGVHALANVAVFDTNTNIPADKISFALNQRLPEDIVIRESYEVPMYFHPRYMKSSKHYQYKIFNNRFPMPIERLYSHFVYVPLDMELMKKAATYLVGEHDFKSFCTARTQVESTVRTVYSIELKKEGDMIYLDIEGNGFLYNMVRIIVGTLIKVGMKVYPPEHVKEILEAKDRNVAGPKAAACGLTLVEINYEDDAITKGIDSIIFDIDGTIWDIRKVAFAAWKKAIEEHSDLTITFDYEELGSHFGKPIDDIFRELYPGEPLSKLDKILPYIKEYEHAYLREMKPEPYEGCEETLKKLSEKYPLYIVTNAQTGYVESMYEATGLEKYFKGHMCHGDTNASKDVTIRELAKKYGLSKPVYVGDTAGDKKSCEIAGVPFIYASYGLGQVEKPEYIIRSISDLQKFFNV